MRRIIDLMLPFSLWKRVPLDPSLSARLFHFPPFRVLHWFPGVYKQAPNEDLRLFKDRRRRRHSSMARLIAGSFAARRAVVHTLTLLYLSLGLFTC